MMLGTELREIRQGLPERTSQAAFAELVGVTRSAVADWEGGRQPVPGAVELVARTLAAHPEILPQMREWRGLSAPSTTCSAAIGAGVA
jgi:DNA-binding transcriptional regulator YiaG